MAMSGLALGDDLTVGDIERSEQRGCAMADVVMGDALDIAESHGQQRLGALECLNLAFLVYAEHHGAVRQIEIKPHDIADLLNEERIVGELEGLSPVRLHADQLEPPLHRALGVVQTVCAK